MNVILAQKLRNAVKSVGGDKYIFTIDNTVINGTKRGCSGFIRNKETGTVVYVDTENNCMSMGCLYRYAFNEDDYGTSLLGYGSVNQFVKDCDVEELAERVVSMLDNTAEYSRLVEKSVKSRERYKKSKRVAKIEAELNVA